MKQMRAAGGGLLLLTAACLASPGGPNCQVGPWAPFSACGCHAYQMRRREVKHTGAWGGRPCPALRQTRRCPVCSEEMAPTPFPTAPGTTSPTKTPTALALCDGYGSAIAKLFEASQAKQKASHPQVAQVTRGHVASTWPLVVSAFDSRGTPWGVQPTDAMDCSLSPALLKTCRSVYKGCCQASLCVLNDQCQCSTIELTGRAATGLGLYTLQKFSGSRVRWVHGEGDGSVDNNHIYRNEAEGLFLYRVKAPAFRGWVVSSRVGGFPVLAALGSECSTPDLISVPWRQVGSKPGDLMAESPDIQVGCTREKPWASPAPTPQPTASPSPSPTASPTPFAGAANTPLLTLAPTQFPTMPPTVPAMLVCTSKRVELRQHSHDSVHRGKFFGIYQQSPTDLVNLRPVYYHQGGAGYALLYRRGKWIVSKGHTKHARVYLASNSTVGLTPFGIFSWVRYLHFFFNKNAVTIQEPSHNVTVQCTGGLHNVRGLHLAVREPQQLGGA